MLDPGKKLPQGLTLVINHDGAYSTATNTKEGYKPDKTQDPLEISIDDILEDLQKCLKKTFEDENDQEIGGMAVSVGNQAIPEPPLIDIMTGIKAIRRRILPKKHS